MTDVFKIIKNDSNFISKWEVWVSGERTFNDFTNGHTYSRTHKVTERIGKYRKESQAQSKIDYHTQLNEFKGEL